MKRDRNVGRRGTAMLVERMWSALRESRKLLEQLKWQLKQMERFVEDNQVNIKQVWKRKNNGLLVKVSGLIFQEPKLGNVARIARSG